MKNTENKIRAARKAAGLSQTELAEKIGVVQSNVCRWERGAHRPQIDTLKKIAEALGTSVDNLL